MQPRQPPSRTALNVDPNDTKAISLQTHQGQDVAWGAFAGTPRIVVFGYTFCPDLCPMGLSNVADALEIMPNDTITPVSTFVTVVPARDTPDVLRDYVSVFHDRLVGLTGTDLQIADLAAACRAVYNRAVGNDDPEFYLIDHTSFVYLIGASGDLLGYYPESLEPTELAAAMAEAITP